MSTQPDKAVPAGESAPIAYMERTRSYYATLGYPPYRWAHFDEVPFTPLAKPVAESSLALITTAAPHRDDLGDQGPGAAYNAAAKFFEVYEADLHPQPNLRISHLGYDRAHTRAEDPATWLPIPALDDAVGEGRLGALCPRLVGVPTNRSQSTTTEQDAPAALAACRRQAADLALLVPS